MPILAGSSTPDRASSSRSRSTSRLSSSPGTRRRSTTNRPRSWIALSFTAGRPTSISRTGALAYYSAPSINTTAEWYDAVGRRTGTLTLPAGHYESLSISPDGTHAVMVQSTSPSDRSVARGLDSRQRVAAVVGPPAGTTVPSGHPTARGWCSRPTGRPKEGASSSRPWRMPPPSSRSSRSDALQGPALVARQPVDRRHRTRSGHGAKRVAAACLGRRAQAVRDRPDRRHRGTRVARRALARQASRMTRAGFNSSCSRAPCREPGCKCRSRARPPLGVGRATGGWPRVPGRRPTRPLAGRLGDRVGRRAHRERRANGRKPPHPGPRCDARPAALSAALAPERTGTARSRSCRTGARRSRASGRGPHQMRALVRREEVLAARDTEGGVRVDVPRWPDDAELVWRVGRKAIWLRIASSRCLSRQAWPNARKKRAGRPVKPSRTGGVALERR